MLRVLLSRLLRNIWHFCHNSTQRRDLGENERGGERSEEEVACKRELEGISLLLLLDFFRQDEAKGSGGGAGGRKSSFISKFDAYRTSLLLNGPKFWEGGGGMPIEGAFV